MAPIKEWIYYKLIKLQLNKSDKAIFTNEVINNKNHKNDYLVKKQNIARNIMKPLFNCPVCMSSVYGSAYYWFVIRVNAVDWILYLIMLAGLIFFMMLLAYNDPRNET